ncbi:glucokinase [Anaeromyxobacter sp. SG17]|uniref:glucokinase n=1 Tax=Anaeromyxobacter sp. SG17 TaxID=2925405 RepID=UPI001F5AFB7A|nr:glucokinase [Anaeromyxobacter sp. SG17]
MILAGDIGGTNARLATFDVRGGRPALRALRIYPSDRFGRLEEILERFLREEGGSIDSAAFGVAGPLRAGVVVTTNLPWVVDADGLAAALGLAEVVLMNDLEALAWSLDVLGADALGTIHAGRPDPSAARAVIAAGTGLGEAALLSISGRLVALPSEGGHADFAPRTDLEIELLRWLRARHGRVSWERVLSGPGLGDAYRFLRERSGVPEPPELARAIAGAGAAKAVSSAALEGRDPVCAAALDLFASAYAAEAGNLALRVLATGGVFLGGGIAPHIVPWLRRGVFHEVFTGKGRLAALLEEIPVHVILDDRAGLLGAARRAMEVPARG